MSGPKTSKFDLMEQARRELERKQQEELRRQEEQRKRLMEMRRYEQEKERRRQEQKRQEREDREKRSGMEAGFDDGFGLSFAAEDAGQEAPAPERPSEEECRRERIRQTLEELSRLPLPDPLKEKLQSLREETDSLADGFTLKYFDQANVSPFVRQCREYAEIRRKHDDLMIRYTTLAGLCETPLQQAEVSEEGNAFLEEQIRKLTEEDLKRREEEYICQTVDEVMREMGYELIGDRTAVRKSGRKTKHQLYSLRDGTAVDVTYGENGQISMELGGIGFTDRRPDAAESAELTEDMRHFCTDYEKLSRRLAERGVQMHRLSVLPPAAEYAQIINVSDYQMTKNVSGYSVRTRKKAAGAQRKKGI